MDHKFHDIVTGSYSLLDRSPRKFTHLYNRCVRIGFGYAEYAVEPKDLKSIFPNCLSAVKYFTTPRVLEARGAGKTVARAYLLQRIYGWTPPV